MIKEFYEENNIEVDIDVEELKKYEIIQDPVLLAKWYSIFFSNFQLHCSEHFKELYEKNLPLFSYIYGAQLEIERGSSPSYDKIVLGRYVLKNYSVISEFFNEFWEVTKSETSQADY